MIYARFSSHSQREVSIDQQIEWCKDLADRNGLSIVWIYKDKAISGKTDNRPDFKKMMEEAGQGKFDYVLAWKSNRMGRNMLEAMLNDAALQDKGVRVIYVEEDFEDNAAGRFALRNMMNVNQFYSEAMAEDIKRGLMDNAKKGMVNGRTTYGYIRGKDGRYEVVEDQAQIIREIYNRVLEGWQNIDIIQDLNNRGIKNRDGKEWKRTSFDKLLKNEQYIGVYRYADIRIENGMPAILDRVTFEAVQRRLSTKGNPRWRRKNVNDYMLTGKLFCGHCGKPMIGICGTSRSGERHFYYMCQGKHQHICDKKNERQETIEAAVVEAVKKIIMDDETIEWLVQGYQEFVESMRGQSSALALEKELDDTEKAISNLMKAIEMGIITETTKERLIELEEKKKDLTDKVKIEKAMLRELDSCHLRFALERFRDKNINSREYQKELINTFIKAIYVYDGTLKIVFNRGKTDNIEIPLKDIQEAGENDTADVRTDATKPHQTNTVRTNVIFRNYGIVVVVPY